jgi:aromatase
MLCKDPDKSIHCQPSDERDLMSSRTDNSVIIDAPIDVVWERTNDVEGWPQLFTEYAAAEVLGRHDGTMTIRLTLHPDAEGRVWSWVSDRTPDPAAMTVTSRRIETGPFEFMNLNWTYREVAGGVEMRWIQEFQMKPGAPFDDEQMTTHLNRNTRTQMDVIRQRIEASADI